MMTVARSGCDAMRRYAFVRQNDPSDCGAAALATIALHHRLPIGLQQMRDLAGTDRVGTNLLGLVQAAERLGFSAKGVKGPYDALPQVPLPAIAHVRTEEGLGHFVVLHRVRKDRRHRGRPGARDPDAVPRRVLPTLDGYLARGGARSKGLRPPASGESPVGPWRRFLGLLGPTPPSWSRPSPAPCS